MARHATPTEPTALNQIERLTKNALDTGRAALVKFGPEAAVVAMQPWSDALDKAQRRAVSRTRRVET